MKLTCTLPEKLSPVICTYVQEVLDGLIQEVSRLPTDIQDRIEWIGVTYNGNVPLPLSDDRFKLEVKLGFEVCFKAIPQSAASNVDVYGKELQERVALEFREQVLLLIEQHAYQLEVATSKTKNLLK